jgi:phosphate butyryltransferase
MDFNEILKRVTPSVPKTVAVAAAEDDAVLKAVYEAYERKIAYPILCGNRERIEKAAATAQVDISDFSILHTDTDKQAAETAVSLVREGKADMLMKGLLQTADLLRAVLNKENGLRKSELLSHVSILHSPVLERMILVTDGAMVMYPDLAAKVKLLRNAVELAHGLGIERPKVAAIAAVETVNPEMQATLDAAALAVMNQRGQITGCEVDGPLAMDLALSTSAAIHKKVNSPVAGRADILLMHNIDVANSAVKVFTNAGGCLFGGLIMGAAAPIVVTSRSDSEGSKLYSIACASSIC